MVRVVVDTNVLISALLDADGSPSKIVALWRTGALELVVSEEVIDAVTLEVTTKQLVMQPTAFHSREYQV